jgi:hypothetical protein
MEVIAQYALSPQEHAFGIREACNAVIVRTTELLVELHGHRCGMPTAPAILARSNLRQKDLVNGFSQQGALRLPGMLETCRFVQANLGPDAIAAMAPDSPVTKALVKLNRLWSAMDQHTLVMVLDNERIECARPVRLGPAAEAEPCAGTYFAPRLAFDEDNFAVGGTLHQLAEPAEGRERLRRIGKLVIHFDAQGAFYELMARRDQARDAYLRITGTGGRRDNTYLFKDAEVELAYVADVGKPLPRDGPQYPLFPEPPRA